ncbi:xanthine dehydrogenase/oxidase-like isoform X2 [Rhopilema esculentum]
MVSKFNRKRQKIEHFSVNACLAPVCSMHGLAITTVEGIGSTKTKLHSVQERMAKFHGSQCGFCTPGIVMSMYTLLRNKPKPTAEDLDTYFQGNLCRCTGYRPIIEGFRTFSEESWPSFSVNGVTTDHSNGILNGQCSSKQGCNGSVNGKCCMETKEKNNNAETVDQVDYHPIDLMPYCPDSEPIFPAELQLRSDYDEEPLVFRGKHMHWYRPTTLHNLLTIKSEYPHAKIVVGNTELGIEMRFKNCQYPVMIQPTNIEELTKVSENAHGVEIGASMTLSEVEEICLEQAAVYPPWKVQVFTEIAKMLKYFGGKQIRNVAAVGGNIMTGSPISDLNPIFLASGCTLQVRSSTETRIIKMDEKFFTGYRKNIIKPEEILVSITIPYLENNDHFFAIKQARRREDDIAIVNAAFRIRLKEGNFVEDVALCFGGMSTTAVFAKNTMEAMLGKVWGKEMIDSALSKLASDLALDPRAPGGMVRYRQSLALSFLFKFYLKIGHDVRTDLKTSEEEYMSALKPLTKGELKSSQLYDGSNGKCVGKPIAHSSGALHATGEAVYCDDMPRLENELYLGMVLSQKAHAKVLKIDAGKALQIEGVYDFVCHEDLSTERNKFAISGVEDEEVFAAGKVQHYGQVIGVIVAIDQATAKRAAKQVVIEYEELPPVVTIEQAVEAGAFHTKDIRHAAVNPDTAWSACDHIIEGSMRTGAQEHFYLETQAVIAIPKGEHGEMEIITSSQNPTATQAVVAKVLGVPANRVICRVKRMGGGFGGKETRGIPLAAVSAAAADKVRRPVRIMLDRDEDIMISGWRHPFAARYKIGFNNSGKLLAADIEMFNNAGWTRDLSVSVLERALFNATNTYVVPHVNAKGSCCKTNLPSNTAFRGFGGPQGMMIAENWINDVALTLGKDPAEVREGNLLMKGDRTYYNQEIEDDALQRCWNGCLEQSQYWKVRDEISKFNSENRWKKRGVSIIPTMFGISYTALFLNQAGALVSIYADGSVLLSHGGAEMGQGLHTKIIQIASETLKTDREHIHIIETATDKVPNTSPTAASASSDLNGMAVYNACCELSKRLEPFRKSKGTWKEAVKAAYFNRVSLSATGFYATPGIKFNSETKERKPFGYFTNGVACSIVEIDCLTGDHRVLKTDIVMDVGKSLNPAIDIGQIEGAFTQGYGFFVMEQMVHSPSGVPFTRGPGAYKIPSFGDVPLEFNVTLLKDAPNPHAVYSSKGIGEPPLFLASSVFFAIKDAIIAARKERGLSAVFKMDAPATAERIRMACEDELTKRIPIPEEGKWQPWGIQV